MAEIELSAEVDGGYVRVCAAARSDRPVEGALINIMVPAGSAVVTPTGALKQVESHFPLVNEVLGPVDLFACERTLYPDAVYVYEARIQPADGSPVRGRAEISGWAGETVSAGADFEIPA